MHSHLLKTRNQGMGRLSLAERSKIKPFAHQTSLNQISLFSVVTIHSVLKQDTMILLCKLPVNLGQEEHVQYVSTLQSYSEMEVTPAQGSIIPASLVALSIRQSRTKDPKSEAESWRDWSWSSAPVRRKLVKQFEWSKVKPPAIYLTIYPTLSPTERGKSSFSRRLSLAAGHLSAPVSPHSRIPDVQSEILCLQRGPCVNVSLHSTILLYLANVTVSARLWPRS